MRSSIAGVVLGALFLVGLFALQHFHPMPSLNPTPAEAAANIEPGFAGQQAIGPWILSCAPGEPQKQAPIPFSLGAKSPAQPSAASGNKLGRCRTMLVFRRKANPQQIILVVTFRLADPGQRLAMIVRLPPLAKTGDTLALTWGKAGLKLPVVGCQPSSCVAGGALAPAAEAQLLSATRAELILPGTDRSKRPAVGIPMAGLSAAIGAMRRAET